MVAALVAEHEIAVQTVASDAVVEEDVAGELHLAEDVSASAVTLQALAVVLEDDGVLDELARPGGLVADVDAGTVTAVRAVPSVVVGDEAVDLDAGGL